MKRILLSLCSFAFLYSCQQPAGGDVKPDSAMAAVDSVAANVKMYAETWDKVINQGSLNLLDSVFSPEITVVTLPANVKGIDSSKAFYANYVTGFTDRKFTVKEIFGSGDKVFKYWAFAGKHTGDFFGIKPTGKTVSVEGATMATIRGGKIVEEHDFFDNMEFMQQLGLVPR